MSNLPSGWVLVQVQDLVIDGPTNGYSGKTGPGGTPTLKLSATTQGRMILDDTTTKRLLETIDESSKYWLEPGDLLVQRANSLQYLGAAAIYDGPPGTYVYPDLMMRLRTASSGSGGYLWRFLNSAGCREHFRANATGTAGNMPKINGKLLKTTPIPVAPEGEQKRIVAKLDALQVRSRRAREALDAIPALLDRFRQSVLAAAFRGDLTADWRAKHPDVDPASVLLERIRAERKVRWIAAEAEKARDRAQKRAQEKGQAWGPQQDAKALQAGRKKAEKNYTEPEPVDPAAEGLPELPAGWCWAAAEELTAPGRSIMYGILKAGPDTPGGVPMVRVMDITRGPLDVTKMKRCHPERAAKFDRATLLSGDLVVSKDGTIGRVAIVTEELAGGNITQHVLRYSPHSDVLNTWLAFAVETPRCQAWMKGETKGVALQGVNVGDFRKMPIALCPAAEQVVLVDAVESRMNLAQGVGSAHSAGSGRLNTLDQAILAKAFRGELVPQDPNDEPAAKLLERIRAERSAAKPKKRSRKR